MKKILLGTVALIALGSSAFAADLPARTYTKAPAYVPAPIYNWTGFYIGGHVGGAFGGNSSFGNNDGRFLGGVQVGADYQFAPNWVLGIEGQYSWSARNTSSVAFVPGAFTISDRNSNLGSVTGRLGYTWGPALLYVKGGVGFREGNNVFVSNTATGAAVPFTSSSDTVGYTVGAGLEYLFAQNWSAKVEYQYYNFGKTNVNLVAPGTGAATTVSYDRDVHTVKAGINYRFNWGGPVVAKY
ncbi:porin family protein [Bradyrhizobium sp. U87765 SZCCT0131]|uniref:outer membrane protein n=1 Tax=unclassified Bradyrhizobium TaxID=2631580 RepID=UPI001BAE2120|nr:MULTISPECIES: outer membrane beta-barrel protein [unclassified Bradyrhizobium]MBR1220124.1 porin family protein [Bradyrhizobium sp. U87765 SZCCT0131]MBR1263420.1 porin family protein [Bradyrhizobium sp. U87765 SZCCT0134]